MKLTRTRVVFVLICGLVLIGQSARADEGIRLQYKAGDGLKIGNGSNLVSIQGRLQGRYTYNSLERATDNNSFAVQRGKIKIEGFTLDKELRFGFQMNLATRNRATTTAVCTNAACTTSANAVTTESTTGLATLEDYYIDWMPTGYVGVKVGQFKVPFLMQELTSSGKQQFVDRSLSTGFFNLSRDIGASFHGDLWDDGLNYSVFVMNGDGINAINRNQSLLTGVRFEYPIMGKYEASESDVSQSEEPNLGAGLAVVYNELGSAIQGGTIAAGTKTTHQTFDIGYKYHGWSVQLSELLTRALDTAKLTNWGYNAQIGYFLVPKRFEVAVKSAGTVFSNAVSNQYEYSAGANYFILGHGLKWQTDYAVLLNNRGQGLNDHRVRTQMQLIF